MYKRLTISLILMGLAVFSIAAGATAYFSDSGSADVQITAGNADLTFEVQLNCEGAFAGPFQFDGTDVPAPQALTWDNIAPGDSTSDCFTIHNSGSVDLELYVKHSGLGGGLGGALNFNYQVPAGTTLCSGPANHPGYTTSSGCSLGSLAAGASTSMQVDVSFPDTGPQNSLEGKSLNMTTTISGRTP